MVCLFQEAVGLEGRRWGQGPSVHPGACPLHASKGPSPPGRSGPWFFSVRDFSLVFSVVSRRKVCNSGWHLVVSVLLTVRF